MTTAPVRKRPAPPGHPAKKAKAGQGKKDAEEEKKRAPAAAADDSATSSDTSDDGNASTSSGAPSASDTEAETTSSDGSEGGEEDKEITVDFEFHDPAPIDFLGARTLLLSLTDGSLPFDVSSLASALVSQARVGTVVKTEAGGDPIALITVFNTDRTPAEGEGGSGTGAAAAAAPPAYLPIPALAHLRSHLAAHAPSPSARASLLSAWAGPRTGLILAERLLNLPPQVAPPLHQALAMEAGWAVADEPTPAGRASFDFDTLLYLSRAFVEAGSAEAGQVDLGRKAGKEGKAAAAAAAAAAAKKGKGKAAARAGGDEGGGKAPPPSPHPPLVYARPEDEHFVAAARWAWWFRVPSRADRAGDDVTPARLVVCLDRAGWGAGRAGLDGAVGNVAAGLDGE